MEELIFKYLFNECTKEEQETLLNWVDESEENLKLLSSYQLLYTSQNLPSTRAESEEDTKFFDAIVEGSVKESRREISILPYLVAATVILLLIANLFINFIPIRPNKKMIGDNTTHELLNNPYHHTIYTENGVKGFVTLPDSSKVWLNSDSKIIFPDSFSGKSREVLICSGEFFFDIAEKPDTPFVIHTNFDMRVEVLGTTFNIRAYSDENEIQTSLVSGSLNLIKQTQIEDKEEVTNLQPNDSYLIRGDNSSLLMRNPQIVSSQMAWRRGELIFEETTIEKVIQKLRRWHGTTFYIDDPEILNFKITATFKSGSIIQIMEMIKFCAPVDYTANDNSITLQKRK